MGAPIDHTGKRMGSVTGLYATGEIKNSQRVWMWLCDCGTQFERVPSKVTEKTACKACVKKRSPLKGRAISDYIGDVFGSLTVVERSKNYMSSFGENKGVMWLCKCKCGNTTEKFLSELKSSPHASCGCMEKQNRSIASTKHGMGRSRQGDIYRHIKQRCDNPKCTAYPKYGARGITYCDKWKTFEGFWEDMQEGYAANLSIDRIDVNGNYCKENCRWATRSQQQQNKRKSVANKTGVTGVSLYRNSFVAGFYMPDGSTRHKSFSIRKIGREVALDSAKKWREEGLAYLVEVEGQHYTPQHGK